MQPEHYDPAGVEGEYRITMTANDGYSTVVKAYWGGERDSHRTCWLSISTRKWTADRPPARGGRA